MKKFNSGLIAVVALLAGTALAVAQESKTQQNAADEALTRSAPEAKDAPQAAPEISVPHQASDPGRTSEAQPFTEGKLAAPGAPQNSEDEPAKFSARNDRIDNLPILAYPLLLSDEQRQAIAQQLGQAPVSDAKITAKVSEQVPATLALLELPAGMAASVPGVADYKFLRLSDRILVVNPRENVVVGEITN
jgi:hypothetical protein